MADFQLPIGNPVAHPLGDWQSNFANLDSRLNSGGQSAEIAHSLQFIIWQFDVEVIFQFRQQIERLQAVDAQRLEKVIVGRELLPGDLEVRGCERKNFVQCLIRCLHKPLKIQLGIRTLLHLFRKLQVTLGCQSLRVAECLGFVDRLS